MSSCLRITRRQGGGGLSLPSAPFLPGGVGGQRPGVHTQSPLPGEPPRAEQGRPSRQVRAGTRGARRRLGRWRRVRRGRGGGDTASRPSEAAPGHLQQNDNMSRGSAAPRGWLGVGLPEH